MRGVDRRSGVRCRPQPAAPQSLGFTPSPQPDAVWSDGVSTSPKNAPVRHPPATGVYAALILLSLLAFGPLQSRAEDAPPPEPSTADALAQLPPAQPRSFKVVLEKAEVKLAEPFGWTLEVRHTPDETYELPASLDWKPFHVRESKSEVKDGGDEKQTTFRLRLQSFDVGDRQTPGFRLLARSSSGVRQLEIPPQKVTVQGVIDPAQGEPKLREERRPLPRVHRRLWWPVAVPGVLALGVLAWWLWRRRRRGEAARAPAKPRPPPYDEAMARIAELESAGLVAKGEKQTYFFRLAEVIRDYLGRRYGFEALELTSDELLSELRGRSTPGLDFGALAGFLSAADLVKFARRDPSDGECKAAVDVVRSFIERTRPLPPVGGYTTGAA
jgi:hypothetical protein